MKQSSDLVFCGERLIYYDLIEDIVSVIAREKQSKGGRRKKALALIEKLNS